ncbi:MAG: DUF1080 domain-containing protein [Verrucomicrobiales bacterium]|jgi:hypothetical protein|nr:DUF1080 domain-containing protein [Verrucomicrobiales bacterium]
MKLGKILTISVLLLAPVVARAGATIELFNGKNLDGWHAVLDPKSAAKPEDTFGVRNGVLTVSGQPFGYIYTAAKYADYRLHIEWRWIEKPSNSGVFLFVQEPKFWPNSIECQLQSGRAGDFIKMGGSGIEPAPGRENLARAGESNENPVGEWNNADLICEGNTISVFINGEFKNRGVSAQNNNGHIALQSEGGPLEFRNIRLTPLK